MCFFVALTGFVSRDIVVLKTNSFFPFNIEKPVL